MDFLIQKAPSFLRTVDLHNLKRTVSSILQVRKLRWAEGGGDLLKDAQLISSRARTHPSVPIIDSVCFPPLNSCCRLPSSGTGIMFGFAKGR